MRQEDFPVQVASRWSWLRWMPAPLFNGGYVVEETPTHYKVSQSPYRDRQPKVMVAWVPKWATVVVS